MTRTRVFAVSSWFACVAVTVISVTISQLAFLQNALLTGKIVGVVLFFDQFLLDFILAILIASICINSNRFLNIIGYLWCLLFIACYGIQIYSIYMSREFVSILAADNLNHISLLLNQRTLLVFSIVTGLFLLLVWVTKKHCPKKLSRKLFWTYWIVLFHHGGDRSES